ncbi:MAG TPA: PAS domain S-box protein [Candidatus Limnocylindria bacterium]|nr:PAS domain S-box protein [Candidatus Limnocylindria bacterium]
MATSRIDSDELLQLRLMALDAAANAIVITDRDGVVVSVNPAFTRLTGFSAAEAIGRTPSILKSGVQEPSVYRDLWATIRAGRVWHGRLVNRRKDGGVYTEEQTITPVIGKDGAVTHFIAVKQDVTEVREAHERLQAHDDLFRLLLENALDIITILAADGTIRYESPAVLRILGYEPHELEGRNAFEFMPEEDIQQAVALIEQLRAAPGATATIEFRFRHKDGSWRILEAVGRNMLDHPLLAGFLINSRDVSERRRIEDELARQQATRMQTDKLADMGTLLAGVAHELNNPLTVVTGYSSILRETLGDGPSRDRLDRIVSAAERCVRIVRNFLALARQHPPERRQVRPNQIVREAVELLAYPLRVDNVEVRLELADDLPTLWADPHQLHQVVVNLITNAHHAMHGTASSRRLTIRTRLEAADSRVSLAVVDTGPGIPAEILGRIFEPFFTTKPVGQGTGLGLPLCQGIVASHGGSLQVDSKPGEGAVFTVELPVIAAPEGEAKEPAVAARTLPRGSRILVVDDEPDVAGVLTDLLKAQHEQVETAADGRAALERVAQADYDLILCDVRMPGMDGPDLYRTLSSTHPELLSRFVFLTGDTLNPESREFVQHTGAPCLSKPFDFDEVFRVVGRALRDRAASSVSS